VVPQCCKVCDGALTIGGPIWTDPIHNVDFIKKFLPIIEERKEINHATTTRLEAILSGILEEEPLKHKALSYDLDYICHSIKSENLKKAEFIYAINQLGY